MILNPTQKIVACLLFTDEKQKNRIFNLGSSMLDGRTATRQTGSPGQLSVSHCLLLHSCLRLCKGYLRMAVKTISHYRVLEKIGEGGMSEVYLAEDTRLDRKVALQFLSFYLQQDEVTQKRFVPEAKSAATPSVS